MTPEGWDFREFAELARAAVLAEREACARLAEKDVDFWRGGDGALAALAIAAAIRARGDC